MGKSECTILTYNILHDLFADREADLRLELIARQIALERPHLIALQEVARSVRCGDVGERLCALANALSGGRLYHLDYARADGAGEGEFAFEDGVALMSRLEPAASPRVLKFEAQVRLATELAGHRYRLPDDRVAMRASYRLRDGLELQACVTHLTDRAETAGGVPIRLLQARELLRWIRADCDSSQALLLAGDLNDIPGSDTIATISAGGFIDLWDAAGQGAGYTNDRDDLDLHSPDAAPNQRIDYLFLRAGGGQQVEIADARLFLERPCRRADGKWLWASDHVGVIASLRL